MEMQASISVTNPDAFPPANTTGTLCPPPLPLTHRRSISDIDLRLPDDLNLLGDPFDVPSDTFDKIAAAEGEDLLDNFVDLDFFSPGGDINVLDRQDGDEEVGDSGGSGGYAGVWEAVRRSQSVDCLNGLPANERKKIIEPKKAMSADKLAELWIVDPKRAKRIMANRQSAARSKERKAHYVLELEKKVQSLQTEATTLSVQHSLFERDTSSLNVENSELRRELEFMEQQAQLRDALNEALESELERLKLATGEKTNTNPYMLSVQQTAYKPAFSNHQPHTFSPSDFPNAKRPKLTKFEPELHPFHQANIFSMLDYPPLQQPVLLNMPINRKIPQLYPLDTNFSTAACQPLYANATSQSPMLVSITHHGIDVGARESWYSLDK